MKKIDRYILAKFLGTFFFMLMLIMAIAIVFDITEKVEDFRKGASFEEIIFDYYINFVAFYGNMFSAMILFISTIWFASKMSSNSEIVAILTGGVSYRRLMYPFFLGSVIIFSISLYLNHFVIPQTNIKRIKFENTYVGHHVEASSRNIHRQVAKGELIYLENFNPERHTGYNFSYEVFRDDLSLESKLKASFVRFDSANMHWRLDNWTLRKIALDGTEEISSGKRIDTVFSFNPKELAPKLYTSAMMTTPDLNKFIEAEKMRGSESLNYYNVERYKRTSWPFSTFILILIAVSLSTKKTRGGLGLNIAIGLVVCLVYVFMMQVSTTFASVGGLSPLLAVWLPNILFFFLGVYLYHTAPK